MAEAETERDRIGDMLSELQQLLVQARDIDKLVAELWIEGCTPAFIADKAGMELADVRASLRRRGISSPAIRRSET